MTEQELAELRAYYKREADRAFAEAEGKRDDEIARLQAENERLAGELQRERDWITSATLACAKRRCSTVQRDRDDAERERDEARAERQRAENLWKLVVAERDALKDALRKVKDEIALLAEWTCTPTYSYRDDCVRPSIRKALRSIDDAFRKESP